MQNNETRQHNVHPTGNRGTVKPVPKPNPHINNGKQSHGKKGGDGNLPKQWVVLIAVAAIAVVAAVAFVLVTGAHAGGTSGDVVKSGGTIASDTAVIEENSTNVKVSSTNGLKPISETDVKEDNIGGGTFEYAFELDAGSGNINIQTVSDGVESGWTGTIMFFDKNGNELTYQNVDVPSDFDNTEGTLTTSMSCASSQVSDIAYHKLYSTDDSGINQDDSTSSDVAGKNVDGQTTGTDGSASE